MAAAVIENETFANYLESMIKIQQEHSASLVKNASKYLDPLKQAYEVMGSQNQHFIANLKELDVSHATKLAETSKQMKDLVINSIGQNTELVKKTAEKLKLQFKKQVKQFNLTSKQTDTAFNAYVAHFELDEESFRQGEASSNQEKDLWFTRY